ncbi:MAG TPA: serine hydrolase domain-containing protein, partial [Gemmatimonadales bacterium]|nr:serine hydrolase domain-containing protein [Gemmatimonadales bacterium]
MRMSPVVFLGPIVLGWSPGPAQQPSAAPERLDVERFTDSVVAEYLRQSAAPSLAVVVTTGRGVVFEKGYGFESLEGRAAVDPTGTLFNIASVSKLFVATAVMQLVDAGKLRLEDRVDRHLPAARLEGKAGPVTIRHLLTHTSGIDAPFMRGTVPGPEQVVPLATYFARFKPRLGREPGREIRYSNEGMALAALIVERVSGERFDAYAERHIFRPLRMDHSSFRQPPPPDLSARVATAGSGPVPNALILYPVGSMVSTVSDVARFMRAHLNGGILEGARILSEESARAMQTTRWTAHPQAPGAGLGFFESDLGGQRGLFHTGARIHFSLLYLLPDRDLGIFLVHSMRQGGPFQPLRAAYVRSFVARYVQGDSTGSGTGDRAGKVVRARERAGVYRPVLLSSTTIEKAALLGADTRVRAASDGSLDVTLPGGGTIRVVEQASGVYRALDGPHAGVVFAFTGASGSSRARMSL